MISYNLYNLLVFTRNLETIWPMCAHWCVDPTRKQTICEFMRSIIFLSSLTLSHHQTILRGDGTISKLTFQTRLVVFHVRPRSWNFLKRVLNWIFHPRRTSHPGSSHLLRWTDGSLWISRHQGEPQLHHQSGNLSGSRLYRQFQSVLGSFSRKPILYISESTRGLAFICD